MEVSFPLLSLYPEKQASGAFWIPDWVRLKASLEVTVKRNIIAPAKYRTALVHPTEKQHKFVLRNKIY
jgi:hypothetical protein